MNLRLSKIENFAEYLDALKSIKDYLVVFAVRDTMVTTPTKSNIGVEAYKKLQELGIKNLREDNIRLQFWCGYVCILLKGQCIYEKIAVRSESVSCEFSFGEYRISILSSPYKSKNIASVRINDEEYSVNKRGFNIVAIDTDKKHVVDSVNFDTWDVNQTCHRDRTDFGDKDNSLMMSEVSGNGNHSERLVSLSDVLTRLKEVETQLEALTLKMDLADQDRREDISRIIRESQKRNPWQERPNTDIQKQLFEEAGRETAEYVRDHMMKCPVFRTPAELRENAIIQAALKGLHLEFGVFSGDTINQVADLKKNQIFYGFDSFEGLPETWRTGFNAHTFARKTLPDVRSNVQLIKGWFDKTLPEFCKTHDGICAYLHVDCDLYSSTKTVFKELCRLPAKTATCAIFGGHPVT